MHGVGIGHGVGAGRCAGARPWHRRWPWPRRGPRMVASQLVEAMGSAQAMHGVGMAPAQGRRMPCLASAQAMAVGAGHCADRTLRGFCAPLAFPQAGALRLVVRPERGRRPGLGIPPEPQRLHPPGLRVERAARRPDRPHLLRQRVQIVGDRCRQGAREARGAARGGGGAAAQGPARRGRRPPGGGVAGGRGFADGQPP